MVLGDKIVTEDIKGKKIVTSDSSEDQMLEEDYKSIGDEMSKFCVLIVDDVALTRLLHQVIVTTQGLEAHVAENGKVAVDLHHSGASFDLILMDRDMPVMNGAEATRVLRAMGVESMIVGVTSHGEGPEQQDFIKSGLADCYMKPITAPQISALVKLVKDTKAKARKSPYNI